MSSKEIGRRLAISPLTVRTHRRAVFAALGVRSVAELAVQVLALAAADTPSE
ncbi:LuxR C-terminal-related transcriptional regulator [Rhizobium sp. TRM95111]|uniref:LuxR C-terminal-related transcriptional regulator n=1 Tax=Rhizobium alarense TaxID=2846851 RepID=UPI001F387CBD|nr:LuxR C-terminal-related transcriptional regulator [Rhizobium alarense]MCF3642305.1 LuxR C-terminal-related transcriptional regulator [Rhizobium alarense]